MKKRENSPEKKKRENSPVAPALVIRVVGHQVATVHVSRQLRQDDGEGGEKIWELRFENGEIDGETIGEYDNWDKMMVSEKNGEWELTIWWWKIDHHCACE